MLITEDELRALFDIAAQIAEGRLTFCIRNASRTLKGWVGDDAYEDAESGDPEDEDRAAALKDAESFLAMYQVLLNTGARIRNNGLVSKEQDASGPVGGSIVNQYYTPKELIELRNEYMAQAQSLAGPFMEEEDQQASLGLGTISMRGGWASDETEDDL